MRNLLFLKYQLMVCILIKIIYAKTVFDDKRELNNNNHKDHTDEYVFHLEGNSDNIEEFALTHGFDYIGPVGSLVGYYRFKLKHERKKRMINNEDYINFEEQLKSHKLVKWYERQKKLVRNKRDFINNNNNNNKRRDTNEHGIDPLWSQMWYLNRQLTENLPDMNVMNAWTMGYSGKGVSVTFLDDGLERDHPDLIDNYDPNASYDFNDNDDDPMPRYDPSNENNHGTRCAGEVAALANNSICSVGISFGCNVGGIRMLDGDVIDSVEAASLSHNRDYIDIYSSSWGPYDSGTVVDGPGVLGKKAFIEGVQLGRKGKGSIFVWAGGNGGSYGDSCSCDGYVNSIYTFGIASTTENENKPWYLEECSSVLATTYSSGSYSDKSIVSTDIRHECTTRHSGTSAAAPLAAGIIALGLEANPNLTWRDVMFIVVLSSRHKILNSNNFIQNKRGLLVSNSYGFGLMDAGRLVTLAKDWINVPPMASCSSNGLNSHTIYYDDSIESIINLNGCQSTENEVNFVEQVEAYLTIETSNRGALEIFLTSPSGTKSKILPKRFRDVTSEGFKNWNFMSVQFWGEDAAGEWKLEIIKNEAHTVQLNDFELRIHGTKEKPIDYESYINVEN